MSRPEDGEVAQFLSDVRSVSRDQLDLIGDVWGKGAADLPTETTSDVNVEIAAIVREERFGPTLAWLVDSIRADAGPAQDDLVIEGLRVGVRARNVVSKHVRNSDASDAVAGMVMVMVLRALLPDSLVAIVAVPFEAVRPGWPLHLDSPQMSSELEPEIESLPFLGTTWYPQSFVLGPTRSV